MLEIITLFEHQSARGEGEGEGEEKKKLEVWCWREDLGRKQRRRSALKKIYENTTTTTMARSRKEKDGSSIKLKHADRSGPDPSQKTLLQMAEQRGLLNIPQALGKDKDKAEPAEDEGHLIGRLGESILWSLSLTMLHFTMDVLVARQYAVAVRWHKLITRSTQAFPST